MAELSIQISAEQFFSWKNEVQTKFPNVLADFLARAGNLIADIMREKAPERTGELRESIGVEAGLDYVKVGPTVSYAVFAEYGTKPHEIVPVRAKALRFEVEGRVIFAKRVWHPGFPGRYFIRETWTEAEPRVSALAVTIFRELFGGID